LENVRCEAQYVLEFCQKIVRLDSRNQPENIINECAKLGKETPKIGGSVGTLVVAEEKGYI